MDDTFQIHMQRQAKQSLTWIKQMEYSEVINLLDIQRILRFNVTGCGCEKHRGNNLDLTDTPCLISLCSILGYSKEEEGVCLSSRNII